MSIRFFKIVKKQPTESDPKRIKRASAAGLYDIFDATFDLSEMIACELATLEVAACLSEQKHNNIMP